MRQQLEASRLGLSSSQELLTQQLKASSALREITNALESSEMRRIRDTMAQFEPFNTREFREIQALNGMISRSVEETRLTFRNVMPKVDPLIFANPTPVSAHLLDATNRVNESVTEGTESLNESIRTEFGSLLTHVKVLVEVNEKMFAAAAADAEKRVAERRSNNKHKIWIFILSFIMAVGAIPGVITIISLIKQCIGWIRHIL
jgi:hypothetical protein